MEVEPFCTDSFCFPSPAPMLSRLSLVMTPPDFPPPPPIPSFMADFLEKDNLTESCDLCSKWGDESLLNGGLFGGDNFTFVLAMVAIISALSGAGIMAAILSVRKYRKSKSHAESMRHLERKCTEHQTLPLPPSRSTNSTPLSNTYCEGPYNDNTKEFPCTNNVYAELHSLPPTNSGAGETTIWRRPPIPLPSDNCYLELRDIPGLAGPGVGGCGNVGVVTALFPNGATLHHHHHHPQHQFLRRSPHLSSPTTEYSHSLTPSTASYYTDLEMKNSGRDFH